MKIKIFWKKDCPDCPRAKEMGKNLSPFIEVQYYDVDTVDGLSEACLLNVMSTPAIVLLDQHHNEIESWRGVVPEFDLIRKRITTEEKYSD